MSHGPCDGYRMLQDKLWGLLSEDSVFSSPSVPPAPRCTSKADADSGSPFAILGCGGQFPVGSKVGVVQRAHG
eukprot:468490-Amphidinium_carterae.1